MTPVIVFGQKQGQQRVDSLLSILGSTHEDTNKVKLLNDLSATYQNIHNADGLKYGHMALALADSLHWLRGEAVAYYSLGLNYTQAGDYSIAIEHYSKALTIAERLHSKLLVADIKGGMARVYMEQYYFPKVEEYLTDAQRSYQELGDKNGQGYMLWIQGAFVSAYYHDDAKAQICYDRAVKLFEVTGNLNGLSKVIKEKGNAYFTQNDFPQYLKYFNMALAIDEKYGFKADIVWVTICIAYVDKIIGRYLESLDLEFRASRMCDELEDKRMKMIALGNTGEVYLGMASDTSHLVLPDSLRSREALLRRATSYLHESLDMAKRNGFQDDNFLEYSEQLSEAQALTGDYHSALESYKLFSTAKDSMFSNENRRKISALEEKQAQQIKQNEIEIQKLQLGRARIERYALIAGLGLMGLFGFVSYRNFRRKKRDNQIISMEKDRSDKLLLNILPSEVAEELKEKGSADAKLFDDVTVLFTDFKGFTTVSERLTPQQLVDELNACFTAFDRIMRRHSIEKIKTVGDAYLAVSGLPLPGEHHAAKIVHAAMDIRDFMLDRKKKLGDMTFEVRIGVHSGSVVAGIVGETKFAYDIWGDTVNIAARMEQNSEAGRINISETTYELVRDQYTCIYRGEIEAKNKGKLKMYFVDN